MRAPIAAYLISIRLHRCIPARFHTRTAQSRVPTTHCLKGDVALFHEGQTRNRARNDSKTRTGST